MKLTTTEKIKLDNIMVLFLQEAKKSFSLKEVLDFIEKNFGYRLTLVSVTSSIKRINVTRHLPYEYCKDTQIFSKPKEFLPIHNLRKEKNILHFNDEVYYDFIKKSFNVNVEEEYICVPSQEIEDALKYEWLFNYISDMDDIFDIMEECPKEYYTTMPKGLFQELSEGKELDYTVLRDFILKTKYGKYWKFMLTTGLYCSYYDNVVNIPFLDKLMKIVHLSCINGDFPDLSDMRDFCNIFKELNGQYELDTNRDLHENRMNMKNILDKEKNELLAKKLQQLNFINNLEFGDYVVVVPQTQEDKQAEGTMQNNCVGHYYDESILAGDNLIYFLRKKENKNHSYITCRYNTWTCMTEEFRKVNNNRVTSDVEIDIINKITRIINEKFKA